MSCKSRALLRPSHAGTRIRKRPQKGTEASARGRSSPPCAPGARPRRAALRGGGSCGGGGAETEAFPVGERSEAPQEAPGERLLCVQCGSRTCLPRPGPASRSGPSYCLGPSPSPARSAPPLRPLCALPTQPEQPAAALPYGPALPAADWGTWGCVRWQLGGRDTPPPAPGAATAAFLPTRHFLPALLRRPTSRAGRRPDSPAVVAAWGSGKRQIGESSRG